MARKISFRQQAHSTMETTMFECLLNQQLCSIVVHMTTTKSTLSSVCRSCESFVLLDKSWGWEMSLQFMFIISFSVANVFDDKEMDSDAKRCRESSSASIAKLINKRIDFRHEIIKSTTSFAQKTNFEFVLHRAKIQFPFRKCNEEWKYFE